VAEGTVTISAINPFWQRFTMHSQSLPHPEIQFRLSQRSTAHCLTKRSVLLANTLILACVFVSQASSQIINPKPLIGSPYPDFIDDLTLSPSGNILAVRRGNVTRFLDVATLKEVGKTLEVEYQKTGAFTSNGAKYATTQDGCKEVSLWETHSKGKCLRCGSSSSPEEPLGDAFATSPSGKTMLYGTTFRGSPSRLVQADCATGRVIHDVADATSSSAFAYFPDEKSFVTVGKQGEVSLWSARDCSVKKQSTEKTEGEVRRNAICVSPDGTRIATLSAANLAKLHVWDATTLEVVCNGYVRSDFSRMGFADGNLIIHSPAANGTSGYVGVYDVSQDEPREIKLSADDELTRGCMSRNGEVVAYSVDRDEAIVIEAQKPKRRLVARIALSLSLGQILLSADGKTIVFHGDNGAGEKGILVWNLPELIKELDRFEAKQREEAALAAIENAKIQKQLEQIQAAEATEERKQQQIQQAIRANQRITWGDVVDLQSQLIPFGEVTNENLRRFVEYGTPENAERTEKGDRFDREEAVAAAAGHRRKLSNQLFSLQARAIWDQRETEQDEPNVVRLRVPLFFKCDITIHDAEIGVACYESDEPSPYALTKDGKLQRYPRGQAGLQHLLEQNAVVYLPELHHKCDLLMTVSETDRELLKGIAREAESHAVNLCFGSLRMEEVSSDGFFKLDRLEVVGFRSNEVISHSGIFEAGDGAPNYFQTKDYSGERAPSFPVADLKRCEIIRANPAKREVLFTWVPLEAN
jgi:WD40 repeat protein